jgi:Putative adhesin
MPTFDTPEPISLTLELGVGDLRILASDRADTVVEVEPSDPAKPSDVTAAEKTRVEYANGVLQIRAPKGWKRYSFRGGGESIDVRIELPTGSQLRGDAALAALRCSGTLGECRYKTGGGDITMEQVTGAAELTTGTGEVRVDRIGGVTKVKNGNGDTWIGEVVGDCQVRAANGKIAVDQAHAAVTAKTANGDIHLDEVAHGAIVAETACGKVDVAVRSGVAAWLDLHTGFGHVDSLLDASEHPGPSEDTVELRARSSFGDITVRRADIGDSGQGAP